ncbi:MAG: LytTR family DNA-binding domain-containing protein [Thiohalocapsa sp.]|jgi:two-component system response regulator AlgR
MRVLVVDDDGPARERLRRLIEELDGDYQVVGEAASGMQLAQQCVATDAELVFLDVQMPGRSGPDLAGELAALDPAPAVVLVTAHPEPARDAFEDKLTHYLVKPVCRQRLRETLRHLPVTIRGQHPSAESLVAPKPRQHLSAHYRGGVQTVAVEDVFYLLAEQKYVTVRHADGRMLIDESLKSLEQEFPGRFMRIHRNALVASDRLIDLEKGADGASVAVLKGCDERLPISRRHVAAVRRFVRDG